MKLPLYFCVLLLIFGTGPGLEAAEIYQWVDKDGVLHFTDGPPPPGAQIVESLSETPSDEPPAAIGASGSADTGAIEGDEKRAAEGGDIDPVEGEENGPTDREDYWRRLGWGNDSSDGEDTGAIEGGENRPTEDRDTGATEGGDTDPVERNDTGVVESGDKRFRQW